MGILTQIVGLILSLSILVVLHEFGHFLFARVFKTRVEKFYLFFNPWFELFKFKKGDTEYGVGWLPLGGYVKISGMIDESMDKEQLSQPPQPWEFRSKPSWQRLLIMVGGVLVNFILALVIYAFILFTWGKQYLSAENVKYGYDFHEIMKDVGFQDGDKILKVDTFSVNNYKDITALLLLEDPGSVLIERDGQQMSVPLPADFEKQVIKDEIRELFTLRVPFVIDSINPDSPAEIAGFRKEDQIISIDGIATAYYTNFNNEKLNYKGKNVLITVERGNSIVELNTTFAEDGVLGVWNKGLDYHFNISTFEYTFMQAIPAGIQMGVDKLVFYVKQMKLVFTKEGASQLGGFGAIGGLFPKTWDWMVFWNMTAFISLVLAFMNILPIPALDGGHVAFLLYEMVTGRKPGDKFLEYAQIVGMVILLSLLLFANGNDIYRNFFK